MSNFGRVVATAIVSAAFALFQALWNPQATLIAGQAASGQFKSSDGVYVQTTYIFQALSWINSLSGWLLLGALVAIWWKPAAKFVGTLCAMIAFAVVGAPHEASAYYDQQDFAEVEFIRPNESAFWIPDVGDNKSTQANFESEEYYRANKIAAKRFQIPHTKLVGSAYWVNYVVPAGRLILVDRAPYAREWVKSAHRGTSEKDQSFPCQSKEGMDITVGLAIGASVLEEEAPKFLYHFGVKAPQGDRTDPKVIFTSVYYGRSLTEVMDGIVRSKIQSLVCNEFTARSFDDGSLHAREIVASLETLISAYMKNVGIRLDHIGWADTFEFDPKVQDAVNRLYIAKKDMEIAQMLAPYTETIRVLAAAEAVRTFSGKSDGRLPTTVVNMPDLSALLPGLFGKAAGVAPATPPVPASK